ncbi:DUF4861 family protein [Echinicola arenosa]|nr:DUF4861 family protein [Echinicola arenosa]
MKVNLQKACALIMGVSIGVTMASCDTEQKQSVKSIIVHNELDFARQEVVAIPMDDLSGFIGEQSHKDLRIKMEGATDYQRTQWIDYDQDNKPDELLFLAEVPAGASVNYELGMDIDAVVPESDVIAYSRFVPERTDDYTWENDKVAFRTYGPTGQKEALAGVAGSTLSSGIDLWLKRTEHSIIDKWYAEHLKSPGYYHIDHGEGFDPYHVGASRGTGGSGIWAEDSLYVSENYVKYNTIAQGPLRTVFELEYAAWSPYEVTETKRITLDLGSNFSKFDISMDSKEPLPNYAVGITLHNKKGEFKIDEETGWIRHWEQIKDSFVGEGIVMDVAEIDSAFVRESEVADQSNLLLLAKPSSVVSYYAGFAWVKSGQVNAVEDWDKMLDQQAAIIKSPLKVTME